jgi:pimeloyl-ACP methyl ester carboxylesterase
MKVTGVLLCCAALAWGGVAQAAKPTIMLVHGAFANASGWNRVIALLQREGYQVIGVENPLQTLQGDVAVTKRMLDAADGPVVMVGHSYGGAIITAAAAGNAKVKALVYVAAIAPDTGERLNSYFARYPSEANRALKQDAAGFVVVDRARFAKLFAEDLPASEGAVLAATQKPIRAGNFAGSVPVVAWKTIPSWYVVAARDRALNPDLERFYAKRMGARTSELDASHFLFLSRPQEIARVIIEAASVAGK